MQIAIGTSLVDVRLLGERSAVLRRGAIRVAAQLRRVLAQALYCRAAGPRCIFPLGFARQTIVPPSLLAVPGNVGFSIGGTDADDRIAVGLTEARRTPTGVGLCGPFETVPDVTALRCISGGRDKARKLTAGHGETGKLERFNRDAMPRLFPAWETMYFLFARQVLGIRAHLECTGRNARELAGRCGGTGRCRRRVARTDIGDPAPYTVLAAAPDIEILPVAIDGLVCLVHTALDEVSPGETQLTTFGDDRFLRGPVEFQMIAIARQYGHRGIVSDRRRPAAVELARIGPHRLRVGFHESLLAARCGQRAVSGKQRVGGGAREEVCRVHAEGGKNWKK